MEQISNFKFVYWCTFERCCDFLSPANPLSTPGLCLCLLFCALVTSGNSFLLFNLKWWLRYCLSVCPFIWPICMPCCWILLCSCLVSSVNISINSKYLLYASYTPTLNTLLIIVWLSLQAMQHWSIGLSSIITLFMFCMPFSSHHTRADFALCMSTKLMN